MVTQIKRTRHHSAWAAGSTGGAASALRGAGLTSSIDLGWIWFAKVKLIVSSSALRTRLSR